MVGWLLNSKKLGQPEAEQEASEPKTKKDADDLVKIEGIGPKAAKVLKSEGITTFETLANAKASYVRKIINAADMQLMNPKGWIAQAKLAARGDWQAFEKLQSELKSGRKAR